MASDKESDNLFPVAGGWDAYYSSDISSISQQLVTNSPEYFDQMGRRMTLNLFHEMAARVPAYGDFLKSAGINSHDISVFEDLIQVPCIDKDNYIRKYPLADLCWDGAIKSPIISASSGSSGRSTYWPRSEAIEIETTYIYELFLKEVYEIDKYRTLLISGFSMGIYIGGTFTLNCCMRLAQKGYPLTIMTPGINQEEILRIVENLAEDFEQVILCGYPPFVRDILDAGVERGIDWARLRLKYYFASESLSEEFRAYLYEKGGINESDYYTSSLNLYGTADAAIAGHEMPLGTYLRRLFSDDQAKTEAVFHKSYVPSLNQYYPFFKYFQVENHEVIFSSAHNEVPMLKYNIHDTGGLITYDEAIKLAASFGQSKSDIEKSIGKRLLFKLPFVYLYGRSDFTVTLYGLNIYPENIKAALETDELRDLCTGKFVLETANRSSNQSQYLQVHIELLQGKSPSGDLAKMFKTVIAKVLREKNSEYAHLAGTIHDRALPEIDLRPRGDSEFFPIATKHKWVKK